MRADALDGRLIATLAVAFAAWWAFFYVGGLPMLEPVVILHSAGVLVAWVFGGMAIEGLFRIYAEDRDAPPDSVDARWSRMAEHAAGGVSLVIAEYFLLALFIVVDERLRAVWPPWLVSAHLFILVLIGAVSLVYFYVVTVHLLALRGEGVAAVRDGAADAPTEPATTGRT